MEKEKLSRQDEILVNISNLVVGPIPELFVEYGNILWDVFKMGKEWQQLEQNHNPSLKADKLPSCPFSGCSIKDGKIIMERKSNKPLAP